MTAPSAPSVHEMFEPQDLRPGLAKYLQETEHGWTVFNHPLWIQVMYDPTLNKTINEGIKHKWDYIKRERRAHKWGAVLSMVERPYRFNVLHHLWPRLTEEDQHELFRFCWTDTENFWQVTGLVEELLDDLNPDLLMDDEERALLEALPDPITVYRGCRAHNINGFSWTTSWDKAKWFAERFNSEDGIVLRGKVAKEDVYAYIDGLDEQEIIAHPMDVEIKKEEKP